MSKNKKKSVPFELKNMVNKKGYLALSILIIIVLIILLWIFYPNLFTKASRVAFNQDSFTEQNFESINGLDLSDPNNITMATDGIVWEDGVGGAIATPKDRVFYHQALPAENDSSIVFWSSHSQSNDGDVYAQKISSEGDFEWSTTNLSGATKEFSYDFYGDIKATKTTDGYMVAWKKPNISGGDIYIQKLLSNGSFGSSLGGNWSNNGIGITKPTVSGNYPRIASISNGAAIVFWEAFGNNLYAQRINSDGSLGGENWDPADPSYGGKLIVNNPEIYNGEAFDVVSTSDGVIVFWIDTSGGSATDAKLMGTKVNFNGNIEWNDITISESAVGYSNEPSNNHNSHLQAHSIGNDILIVFDCDPYGVCIQKVTNSGIAGGGSWGTNGIGASDEDGGTSYPNSIKSSDGSIFVKWQWEGFCLQKISIVGTRAWDEPCGMLSGANGVLRSISADSSGGIIAVQEGDDTITITGINSEGENAWEKEYSEGLTELSTIATSIDSSDQIFVFWDDNVGGGNNNIFVQKFSGSPGVGEPITPSGSGYAVANALESGSIIEWDTLDWQATIPGNSSIDLEFRSALNFPGNIALNSIGSEASASSSCDESTCGIDLSPGYVNDGEKPEIIGGEGGAWVNNFTSINLPESLTIDLKNEKEVGRVVLYSLNPDGGGDPFIPTEYKIQTSRDGIDWYDQVVVPGDIDENQDIKIIEHSFPNTQARYVRLYLESLPTYPGPGGGPIDAIIISEFEIFSGESGGWSCEWGSCQSFHLTSVDAPSGSIDISYLPDGKYFQYKVTLNAGSMPVLEGITISQFAPSPTYIPKLKETVDKPEIDQEIGNEIDSSEKQSLLEGIWKRLESLEKRIETLEKTTVNQTTPVSQPVSQKTYIVQPKDYLISIAQKVYGNMSRWYDLVSLNKDRYPEIANPPHMIRIGWELKY